MKNPLSLLGKGGMWIRVGALSAIDATGHPTDDELAERGVRAILTHRDRAHVEGQLAQILKLLADGSVVAPRIDVMPWTDVRRAHEEVETGRARGRVVTAAVKEMAFELPVKIGDTLNVYTEIVRVGRTSITLSVEAWAHRARHRILEKVTAATFIMVALDEDGKPVPVPAVEG